MKCIFFLIVFFVGLTGLAQTKTEKYYDYNWNETKPENARFYSIKEKINDSLWHVQDYYISSKNLQMKGYYKDEAQKIKEGKFYHFNNDGKLSSEANYTNGKKNGNYISYHLSGAISDSTFYLMDVPVGMHIAWHENGFMKDSVTYLPNNKSVHVGWWDTGIPSYAGIKLHDKKTGTWQYFYESGKLSAIEKYKEDKVLSRTYFKESGETINDTANRDAEAVFRTGGLEGWARHIQKKVYVPRGYILTDPENTHVIVTFTIDKTSGETKDINLVVPFNKVIDDIVIKAIKSSPKWKPAVQHGCNVDYRFKQSINIRQVEN